jgi:hypothetical protein
VAAWAIAAAAFTALFASPGPFPLVIAGAACWSAFHRPGGSLSARLREAAHKVAKAAGSVAAIIDDATRRFPRTHALRRPRRTGRHVLVLWAAAS